MRCFLPISILFTFHLTSCSVAKIEYLLPHRTYDRIEITKFTHSVGFNAVYGEVLNNTDYVLTRLVFKFELYKYDKNCRLKSLYDVGGTIFELGDFADFVKEISKPSQQKRFHDAVSRKYNIGSLADLVNTVEQFNKSDTK